MAVKANTATIRVAKSKVKRKGVHAKTKQSSNKNSVNYKKPNVGQG
jgi:hypothetical protein